MTFNFRTALLRRSGQAVALAVALVANDAAAQTGASTRLSLVPPDAGRWEIAGQAGWLGGHKPGVAQRSDDWYDNGTFSASLARYWTTHFKTEVETSVSTEGSIYAYDEIRLPGAAFATFRPREHHFRNTTASASAAYQFFENATFHPFLGAGVDLNWEHERTESPEQIIPTRDPRVTTVLPALQTVTDTRFAARPFVAAGFKAYFSERGFFRSDIKTSFGDGRTAHVVWRAGIGVDF